MKKTIPPLPRLLTSSLALLLISTTLWAGDETTRKKEMRVLVSTSEPGEVYEWVSRDGDHTTLDFDRDDMSAEASAFLGVETTKVGATLGKQLGLDRGIGLVVARVVPETGAADVLEKHDLLVKFEDQWLVSSDQLGVLIRSQEPGTEVNLTIVRDGTEKVVAVTLGERQVRRHASMALPAHGTMSREDLEVLIGKLKESGEGLFLGSPGSGTASIHMMNLNSGTVVFTDDQGTVKLISKGDGKRLVVTDREDNILFDGPVDSEAQREALSDEVKERLSKVENIRAMEMPDEDFEMEEDVRVLVPHASHQVEVMRVPVDG